MPKLNRGSPLFFTYIKNKYFISAAKEAAQKNSIAATEDPTLADADLGDLVGVSIMDQFTPDDYEAIYYDKEKIPHWFFRLRCFQPLKDTWRDLTNLFSLDEKPYRAWRHAVWDFISPVFGLADGVRALCALGGSMTAFVVGCVAFVGRFFPQIFPNAKKICEEAFPLSGSWFLESFSYAVSSLVKLFWPLSLCRFASRMIDTHHLKSVTGVGIRKVEDIRSKKALARKGLAILNDPNISSDLKQKETDNIARLLHLDYNQRLAKTLVADASKIAKARRPDLAVEIMDPPNEDPMRVVDIGEYIREKNNKPDQQFSIRLKDESVIKIAQEYRNARKAYQETKTDISKVRYQQAIEAVVSLQKAAKKAYQAGYEFCASNPMSDAQKNKIQGIADEFYRGILKLIYPGKSFRKDSSQTDFVIDDSITIARDQYYAKRRGLTDISPREEMELYYGIDQTRDRLFSMDLGTRVRHLELENGKHILGDRKTAYFTLFSGREIVVNTTKKQHDNGHYPDAEDGDDAVDAVAPPVINRRGSPGGLP